MIPHSILEPVAKSCKVTVSHNSGAWPPLSPPKSRTSAAREKYVCEFTTSHNRAVNTTRMRVALRTSTIRCKGSSPTHLAPKL